MSLNTRKPVIFFSIASTTASEAAFTRNLPEEARQVRGILEQTELCELVEYAAVTAQDVCDAFQNPRYGSRIAIFHFGGHPNSHEKLFKPVDDSQDLAAFLRQQSNLQMVFLNGCSNQGQIERLLKHVPVIVATSPLINDQAAVDFAKRFYRGLIGGRSIRAAYNQAEAALRTTIGSNVETLYRLPEMSEERWPWRLYIRPGAETVADWRLAQADENPMFGLPLLPQLPLPEKPFRYLNWFRQEHAEVFFGRGTDIQRLYERITTPRTAPIILMYGQSGVGKSSLLEAGLLPRLEKSHQIRCGRRDQDKGLRGTLAELLGHEVEKVSPVETWLELEKRNGKPLILILDQVEEAYTSPENDAAREMADLLGWLDLIFSKPAERPQGKLILSFRQEWLAEIEKRLKGKNLFITTQCIADLNRRGIIEAVTGISRSPRLQRHYGLTIEHNLPEIIADDLLADRHSALAPTLQILLTKLWDNALERSQEQLHFDLKSYQTLKKEGLLLEDFLDQQLAELRTLQPEAVDSGLALDILAFHSTSLGTAEKRRAQDLLQRYAHKKESLPQLIRDCTSLSLLAEPAQSQADQTSASRLVHDTLAPLIRQRFDESERPGQRARRILESFAREWRRQAPGPLLDSKSLEIVEQGKDGMRAMSDDENLLVKKSALALGPPILTQELFPPDLNVREFIPGERLDISVGIINNRVAGAGMLMLGVGQIAAAIPAALATRSGRTGRALLVDGAKNMEFAAQGQYLSFDLKRKQVKWLSKTDEWQSSIVKFTIIPKKESYIGQLVVDDNVFYETKPLQSREAVEDLVDPFCRALNSAMGFDTKIQYIEEDNKASEALSDSYVTPEQAKASLQTAKQILPDVSDAYESSGIIPMKAKLGFLVFTPIVAYLTLWAARFPADLFWDIVSILLPHELGLERYVINNLINLEGRMIIGVLILLAQLIGLAIIALLIWFLPGLAFSGISSVLKNRNQNWPFLFATLAALIPSIILFWPGLGLKILSFTGVQRPALEHGANYIRIAPTEHSDSALKNLLSPDEYEELTETLNDEFGLDPTDLPPDSPAELYGYDANYSRAANYRRITPTERIDFTSEYLEIPDKYKVLSLAPDELALGLFGPTLRWLVVVIGVILVPLFAGGTTSVHLEGQKFCEISNVFLKPVKTLTLPLDQAEELSTLLSDGHYAQLGQMPPAKNNPHTAKLELWWHKKAETAYLELTASFKGKFYVIDNKEGKQEEKSVEENWLIYSEKLDRAGAEAFLADVT